ncbi:unnamed protein product [Thlaspi arvense]|uniref:Embryo surrounding factor 1 brassicaceae domain-containing protein n=1 Tax=Thlaspi arvense TaxID=13288 RepID=A0AAU9RCE4_THLAR|nr:unnamed protein product [Thlaspi arvense]
MQMNVEDIERSSKLYIPKCVPSQCKSYFKRDCWCCFKNPKLCWTTEDACVASSRCPPLNFLKN